MKAYKKSHGIDIDSIVGPAMPPSLDDSAKQRVGQIRVNMEDARWAREGYARRKIQQLSTLLAYT